MTELRVWRADESDRATAYGLVEEYNEEIAVVLRDSPESFAASYFARGSGLWLAESRASGGHAALAGCVGLRPLVLDSDRGCLAAEIKRMYVRPAFRGTGAATALLVALEQYAEAHGYAWLYLDTKDDLKAATRFYDRHGYQPCERYNANPQATVFLRKALRPPSGEDGGAG